MSERRSAVDLSPAGLVDWTAVIGGLSEAVVAADAEGRVLYVNSAVTELLGWETDDLVGGALTRIIPERLRAGHHEGFRRFVNSGRGHLLGRPLRVPALRRDGTETPLEMVVNGITVADRPVVVSLLRDVSDRVELEGPGDLADRLVAILAESASLDEAWPRVLTALVESLQWDLAQLWLVDYAKGTLDPAHTCAAAGSRFDRFVDASDEPLPRGCGLPGRVWASRTAIWLASLESDLNFPRAASAAKDGLRSGFAFPLTAGTRLLGVIELFSIHRRNPNPTLQGLLVGLGRELGWFLERRAELERSAELAATLQRSLMPPQLPAIPGVDVAAQYRPAGQGTEVGGDFYDVFRLGRDSWGIVIGDVCGKGAEAATVTAFARYTIRAAAMQTRSPARALAVLNQALIAHAAEGGPDLFVTVALVRLRHRPGGIDITAASGGHPLPLVRRADGRLEQIGQPGILLGVFERVQAHDAQISLNSGDMLVMVTDGVLEARRDTEMWGDAGLATLLDEIGRRPAAQMAEAIAAGAVDFRGGRGADDIAVVVLAAR